MKFKFYLDESGNSGENPFDSEQPYFVLSGLLLNSKQESELTDLVTYNKPKFNIQGNELKSTALYKSKDKFIKIIFNYLKEDKIPIFAELVNKKHFIAANISTFIFEDQGLLNKGYISKKDLIYNNAYLTSILDHNTLKSYLEFSKNNNHEKLLEFISNLKSNMKQNKDSFFKQILIEEKKYRNYNKKQILNELKEYQNNFLNKINIFKSYSSKLSVDDLDLFCPSPNLDKRGNVKNLLPNLTSIMNISSRLSNYIKNNNINLTTIIHDVQKDYDEIFKQYFNQFKQTNKYSSIDNSMLNVNLEFENAKETNSIPLQVADLISGVIFRYFRNFDKNKIDNRYTNIFKTQLIYNNVNEEIQPLNFVIPVFDRNKFLEHLE